MSKIVLKNLDTKKFISVIKRSSALDKMIFVNVEGTKFDSVAFNGNNKTVVKRVESDLSALCEEFENENTGLVKFLFTNANKLIQALSLVGTDDVTMVLHYDETGFGVKAEIFNKTTRMNIVCGEKALAPIEMPVAAKTAVFGDKSKLVYSFGIDEKEFKYFTSLFEINKEAIRVYFSKYGDTVYLNEIEAKTNDEIDKVMDLVANDDFDGFRAWEKLYNKEIDIRQLTDGATPAENYISAYNKPFFDYVDGDNLFDFEVHQNKLIIYSSDEETATKSTVVIMPIKFN